MLMMMMMMMVDGFICGDDSTIVLYEVFKNNSMPMHFGTTTLQVYDAVCI